MCYSLPCLTWVDDFVHIFSVMTSQNAVSSCVCQQALFITLKDELWIHAYMHIQLHCVNYHWMCQNSGVWWLTCTWHDDSRSMMTHVVWWLTWLHFVAAGGVALHPTREGDMIDASVKIEDHGAQDAEQLRNVFAELLCTCNVNNLLLDKMWPQEE